jgi:uncharacterized membrane protein YciS (DUF1049 family)
MYIVQRESFRWLDGTRFVLSAGVNPFVNLIVSRLRSAARQMRMSSLEAMVYGYWKGFVDGWMLHKGIYLQVWLSFDLAFCYD